MASLAIKVQYEKSGTERLSKSARIISKSEQLTFGFNCLVTLAGFDMPV